MGDCSRGGGIPGERGGEGSDARDVMRDAQDAGRGTGRKRRVPTASGVRSPMSFVQTATCVFCSPGRLRAQRKCP